MGQGEGLVTQWCQQRLNDPAFKIHEALSICFDSRSKNPRMIQGIMQLHPLSPFHFQAGCKHPELVLFDVQSHRISTAGLGAIAYLTMAIGKHVLFGFSPTEFVGWGAGA